MAAYAPIKIQHSPIVTYPGTTQTGFVGAQTVAGQRGTLPTFNNANSYFIAKTGSDANAGTSAAPKLTLGSLFSTTQSYNDTSGNGYNLTQVGTVPYLSYPCNPIPPQGNFAAGPFSDSNYLTAPAGLYGALTGATQYCVEGYVYFNDLTDAPYIFRIVDTSDVHGRANADGSVTFSINGTDLSSSAATVTTGVWYYFAFSFQSVTASAKKIWIGTTPANAVNVASATQTRTMGTVTGMSFGKPVGTANRYLDGYLDRVVVSSVLRSSFPVSPSASNILGFYEMETRPLMQTAPLSYIVIQDSGEYNEGLYANFQYDITAGFGIYAADGYAPTFKLQKGVFPGTYGAGNASYVQLTSSTSTTCFVSKSGNDGTGTRGNASLPFLTIQAAMTATTTAGDTVQIQDSGTYLENVTVPNRALTLQAATGQAPVIQQVSGTNLLTAAGASDLSLAGILFIGVSPLASRLYLPTATMTLFITDCTIQNINYICGENIANLENCYLAVGNQKASSGTLTTGGMTLSNCFLTGLGIFNLDYMRNCTISGSAGIVISGSPQWPHFDQCNFIGAGINYSAALAGVINSNFYTADDANNYALYAESGTGTARAYMGNCYCEGSSTGVIAQGVTVGSDGFVFVQNSDFLYYETGVFFHASSTQGKVKNLSTLDCSVAGVTGPSGLSAIGLADSLSTAAHTGGVAPTSSISNAAYASTSAGNENLTLAANSPGAFLVTTERGRIQDAGIQSALFDIVMPSVSLNGLILEGSINAEGGISSLTSIVVQYCTFNGLGTYGINVPALSIINNNLFNVNGHALKEDGYSSILVYNAAYACGGAFLQHYGRTTTISNNTAYACEYGQYDSVGSTFSTAVNLIYAGSGAYDYSGENELSYSDVGTLDPARNNSLDTNSIQQDPLFVNASQGDLTLQALARDFYWNSPCIGTSSTSADMGAYVWTYGSESTAWTTIDFADPDYYNPDQVLRRQLPVKLAEGDMENGAIYSVQATFKKEYEFTWSPNTNPMSLDQLDDLVEMFLSFTNRIQIDFGDGRGYVPAYFGRQQGFEYADMTGYYSDDEVPEPLRTLTIREA